MLPVLVAIATHNRLEFTKECVKSLLDTTTPEEIAIGFFDNGSADGTVEWLNALTLGKADPRFHFTFHAQKNVGTARGISHVWRLRKPGQYVIKLDNDVTFNQSGWVTRMVEIMRLVPKLGQVGLKRRDLSERAYHPGEVYADPDQRPVNFFHSQLFELQNGEVIEVVNHVMGTCVMFSPKAVEEMGDLYQMQDEGNVYGFDDSLASLRLRMLGFQCAHVRGTFGNPLTVNHIDPGEHGAGATEATGAYTRLKIEMARVWMPRYTAVAAEFESGQREPFWMDSEVDVEHLAAG